LQAAEKIHTPNMALLALVGTILLTVVVGVGFIVSLAGFLRGVVPAISLLASFIRVFATLSLAVFFYVFHRAQA
jgi:hypothetical protein